MFIQILIHYGFLSICFENNNCDFFAVIENKRLGAPSYKMSIREDYPLDGATPMGEATIRRRGLSTSVDYLMERDDMF